MQNNLIDIMDDIIELGSLDCLEILEYGGNPVCAYMKWINMLKVLLYPEKYQP